MKRRLLNILTALSLLVCVAVCVLWVRSYSAADGILLATGPHTVPNGRVFMPGVQFISFRGNVGIRGSRSLETDTDGWHPRLGGTVWVSIGAADWVVVNPWTDDRIMLLIREQRRIRAVAGVAWVRYSPGDWYIGVRHATVTGVAVVLPAARLVARLFRRRRLRRLGVCLTCGYDLTGNVSGVCPECGKAT